MLIKTSSRISAAIGICMMTCSLIAVAYVPGIDFLYLFFGVGFGRFTCGITMILQLYTSCTSLVKANQGYLLYTSSTVIVERNYREKNELVRMSEVATNKVP